MRLLGRSPRGGEVLLRHPIVSLVLMLGLSAGPLGFWYVQTHPVRHTEVCSYRSYLYSTGQGSQSIRVSVPVYCDRPAGP